MPTARELIRQEYGASRNLLTPYLIRYGYLAPPRFAYELSWGRGFTGGKLFGVSVVEVTDSGTQRRPDLSSAFHSRGQAETYLQTLDRELQATSCPNVDGVAP